MYIGFIEFLLSFIPESLVFQNYIKSVKIKYTEQHYSLFCVWMLDRTLTEGFQNRVQRKNASGL
jgi:hypothetical protein